MSNNDHKANQANKNKGSSGTNAAYQKVIDNRSRQLNNEPQRVLKRSNGD